MVLFLAACMPLLFLLVTWHTGSDRLRDWSSWFHFARGMVVCVASTALISLFTSGLVVPQYGAGLYFYHFVLDFLLPMLFLAGGALLLFGVPDRKTTRRDIFDALSFYGAGFFTLSNLAVLLSPDLTHDAYLLFFVAPLRAVLLYGGLWLFFRSIEEASWLKYLWLSLCLVLLPALLAFVPFLHYMVLTGLALPLTLILVGGVFFLFYLRKSDFLD